MGQWLQRARPWAGPRSPEKDLAYYPSPCAKSVCLIRALFAIDSCGFSGHAMQLGTVSVGKIVAMSWRPPILTRDTIILSLVGGMAGGICFSHHFQCSIPYLRITHRIHRAYQQRMRRRRETRSSCGILPATLCTMRLVILLRKGMKSPRMAFQK